MLAPVRKPRGSECFGDMRCPCYRQVKRCLRAQAMHGAHCAATMTQYPKTKCKSCLVEDLYKVCVQPRGAACGTAGPAAAACKRGSQPAGWQPSAPGFAPTLGGKAPDARHRLRITIRRLY